MSRSAAIEALLGQSPRLWRGREPNRNQHALPTGHARLDARLPGGGWPVGALTELIAAQPGLGEFSLLFPLLARLSRDGQWLILVDPPWIPYPAALRGHGVALERVLWVRTGSARESLWACEQALATSRGGAVLAWPELRWNRPVGFARLRRLQLAAEAGAQTAFLFRPDRALQAASPAALRLRVDADAGSVAHPGSRIEILKCRGERPAGPAWLPPHHAFARSDLPHTEDRSGADAPRAVVTAAFRSRPDSPALN